MDMLVLPHGDDLVQTVGGTVERGDPHGRLPRLQVRGRLDLPLRGDENRVDGSCGDVEPVGAAVDERGHGEVERHRLVLERLGGQSRRPPPRAGLVHREEPLALDRGHQANLADLGPVLPVAGGEGVEVGAQRDAAVGEDPDGASSDDLIGLARLRAVPGARIDVERGHFRDALGREDGVVDGDVLRRFVLRHCVVHPHASWLFHIDRAEPIAMCMSRY
ncbi:hypothetical protein ABE10_11480 [Bacillus toyonensis]|nr:hypothetical protein [Bacillus toyonensis]